MRVSAQEEERDREEGDIKREKLTFIVREMVFWSFEGYCYYSSFLT